MQLHNKKILVTGSSRGIGKAIALQLAQEGAEVVIHYSENKAAADEVLRQVEAYSGKGHVLQADLRDPDACARVVDQTVDALGRLDILVNMASVYRAVAFDDLTSEDWNEPLEVDLRAAWLCTQAAVPYMRRLRGGRIVNISDWVAASGRPRYPRYLPYYVAKRAVMALTEALALELADDQILVNAIAPGPIVAPDGTSEREFRAVERATPLGRWGGEGEVAKAVASLVESDFITGETIRVDGGRHLK